MPLSTSERTIQLVRIGLFRKTRLHQGHQEEGDQGQGTAGGHQGRSQANGDAQPRERAEAGGCVRERC